MKKTIDYLALYGESLPGEDRSYGGNGFYFDMVPALSHFHSLRLMMPLSQWQKLRLYVLIRAGRKCEFCASTSNLEAHERWSFDHATQTQSVRRLLCLCKSCHQGVHIGVTAILGFFDDVKKHVLSITGWTSQEFEDHLGLARENYRTLSTKKWKIDVSLARNVGIPMYDKIKIQEKIEAKRDQIAKEELKYSIDGMNFRSEMAEGWVAFCTLNTKREDERDSILIDHDGPLYYGAKKFESEPTFPILPLKDFVAAYNNPVEVCDEIQLADELKNEAPKRLILKKMHLNEELVKSEFKRRILFSPGRDV